MKTKFVMELRRSALLLTILAFAGCSIGVAGVSAASAPRGSSIAQGTGIIAAVPSDPAGSISGGDADSRIDIVACVHDAGAICSLRWHGKEFIDDFDHGRQLQSASSFDHLGEFFNPTEAGSKVPCNGENFPSIHPSSSVLEAIAARANVLATQTRMALWQSSSGGCEPPQPSRHLLHKQVTIGMVGLPNVIQYLTDFKVPQDEHHRFGQFEVVTGYMPREFDTFWTLNVKSRRADEPLRNLSPVPAGEQPLPVIASTTDRAYAMGVYCPKLPQTTYASAGYGRFHFPDVVKWNAVFRITQPPLDNHFECYLAVGDLETVRRSLLALGVLIPK